MKGKKILYIHPAAGGGGASTSLFLLVNDMNDKSDYEPVVLLGQKGPFEELLRKKGVKIYIKKLSVLGINTHSPKISAVAIFSFLIRFLPNIIMVYKIIKSEKISLVHINSSVSITSAIASYLAGVKVIWHIREVIPDIKMGRLQKALIKFIASDIIAISKEVAKQLDSCKTTLIYNGINPEKFRPDLEKEIIRKKYGLNGEKETIFTHISQLFPKKGTFIFLKAAKLLVKSGYNVRFFVIGGSISTGLNNSFSARVRKMIKHLLGLRTNTWKEELEEFVRDEGIAERVVFTGYRDDIPNFISVSNAIVAPHYISEPFGRTLIEAGALKKPVISTRIPPTPEIVIDGKTGLLVEPKNTEALAEAMKYIIDNPIEARKMGEAGYQNVIKNFHIDTTHSKIRKLYERILGKESQMFTQRENALIDLLRQVKKVLDKHNIEFWLDCGTLLGAVRDGKFVSWEHDIDFGAWQDRVSESVKISISRELCNEGFDVYVAKNWITIKKGEEIWADINFYCLINNKAIMPKLDPKDLIGKFLRVFSKTLSVPYYYKVNFRKISSYLLSRNISVVISRILPPLLRRQIARIVSAVYKKMSFKDVSWIIPSKYFMSLSTMKFYGMEFKVPAKTEEYLIYRYGENWRIPRKNWITNRDDGTIGDSSF